MIFVMRVAVAATCQSNPEKSNQTNHVSKPCKGKAHALETKTMNEKEQWEIFYEIFDASLPRLGPGDDVSTKKALDTLLSYQSPQGDVFPKSAKLRILHLGCGNGGPTIQLAKHAPGTIIAVDNHEPFLAELRRRAEVAGVSGKIQVHLGDMKNLEFDEDAFNLIWSESAIFVMGFGEGLALCRRLLAPHGLLAVSELAWLMPDPPDECRRFFETVYPAMVDIAANIATIKDCGFKLLEHFTLPDSSWWDTLYHPLEKRVQLIRKKYDSDTEKLEVVERIQKEIDIFREYSSYYGNVFYLMRR